MNEDQHDQQDGDSSVTRKPGWLGAAGALLHTVDPVGIGSSVVETEPIEIHCPLCGRDGVTASVRQESEEVQLLEAIPAKRPVWARPQRPNDPREQWEGLHAFGKRRAQFLVLAPQIGRVAAVDDRFSQKERGRGVGGIEAGLIASPAKARPQDHQPFFFSLTRSLRISAAIIASLRRPNRRRT